MYWVNYYIFVMWRSANSNYAIFYLFVLWHDLIPRHYSLDSSKSVEEKYPRLGIETLMFCINMTYICVTRHDNLCFISRLECGLDSKNCDSFITSFRKSFITKKNVRFAVTTPIPIAPEYGLVPMHWNFCSFSWYNQCMRSIVLQWFG